MSICLGEIQELKLNTINVLVIDEDAVYQGLLCRVLGSYGIQVVGRASKLEQAVLLYQATWPSVVLVGISSGNKDKLDNLSKIKEIDPLARFIVLSVFSSVEDILQGAEFPIDAYVTKGCSGRKIVNTIRGIVVEKKV